MNPHLNVADVEEILRDEDTDEWSAIVVQPTQIDSGICAHRVLFLVRWSGGERPLTWP